MGSRSDTPDGTVNQVPKWLRALPKWLRGILGIVLVLIAAVPGIIGPNLADSLGWGRGFGSNVGWIISMVLFVLLFWLGRRIAQQEARREVVTEMDQLLKRHREDGTND